jgi:hypothetical protein
LSCSPAAQPHQGDITYVSPQLPEHSLSWKQISSHSSRLRARHELSPKQVLRVRYIDTDTTRSKRIERTDYQIPKRTAFPKPSHCPFPLPTNVDPVMIRAPLEQYISSRPAVSNQSDACHQLCCVNTNALARPRTPESPVNFGSLGTPPAAIRCTICLFL